MHIKDCPCCKSKAELFVVNIKEADIWQISCIACGLATDYDEDKNYLLQKWNNRKELEKQKKWLFFLFLQIAIIGITTFFAGYIIAIKSLL